MAGKRSRKGKQGKSAAAAAAMMMMMPTTDRTSAAADTSGAASTNNSTTTTTDAASSMVAGSTAQQQQQYQQQQSKDEMELILTSEKRRGVYHCDYCHSDISQLPRIRCAVCPEFDLCLDCFTTTDHAAASRRAQASVETQNALQESANRPNPTSLLGMEPFGGSLSSNSSNIHHDDTHGYRVCDSTRYPLFPNPRNVVVLSSSSTSKSTTTSGTTTPVIDNTTTITTTDPRLLLESISEEKEHKDNDDGGRLEEECVGAKSAQEKSSQDDDDAMEIDKEPSPSSGRLLSKEDEDVEMSDDAKKPTAACASVSSIPVDQATTTSSSTKAASFSKDIGGGGVMTSPSDQQQLLVHNMDADIKAMWTVEEDLRLLEGIKTHGLGNWVEISEAVSGQGSTGKSPRRCMERYFDDFLGRYGHILPPFTLIMEDLDVENDNTIFASSSSDKASGIESSMEAPALGEGTRISKRRAALVRNSNAAANQQSLLSRKKFRVIATESIEGYENVWPDPYLPNSKVAIGQEVGRDQACKAEQVYVKTVASIQSLEEVERIRKEWAETKLNRPGGPTVLPPRPDDVAAMSGAELAGFMPRRGDFDVEWENDAEQAVADMEFLPDDSEADKQLKLQVLAIYNSRLHERERRKEFVLSRKLWDYRKLHQAHQKLPRDERDLVHRMRLFERFHTPAEHQKFIEDLLKAKRLRKEIAKLQMYRRMGIRTLADAEKYELDKTRRQYHKMVQHPNKESSDPKKTTDSAAGAAAAGDSGRHASLTDASSSSSLWKQYQYRTSDRKARKSINRGVSGGETMDDDTKPPPEEPSPPKANNAEQDEKDSANPDNDATKDNNTTTGNSTEGLLLSPQEVSLCQKLHLAHDLYIIIRKTLISESLQKGLLDKEGAGSSKRALVKLDIEQRDGVIDFFLTAGWVSTKMSQIFRGTDGQPKAAVAEQESS